VKYLQRYIGFHLISLKPTLSINVFRSGHFGWEKIRILKFKTRLRSLNQKMSFSATLTRCLSLSPSLALCFLNGSFAFYQIVATAVAIPAAIAATFEYFCGELSVKRPFVCNTQ